MASRLRSRYLLEEMIQKLRRYPPVLKGVHRAVQPLLKRNGFEFEVRRAGDLKLGLWRKRTEAAEGRADRRRVRRLVIVPGFADTPLSWLHTLAYLRPVTRSHFDEIVLVDFPGFNGLLCDEKAFHSFDLLFGTLHDLFDSLQPHTLMGHSLGGWIAASYGAACGSNERPRNASGKYAGPSRLILMNPAGVLATEAKANAWRGLFDDARANGFGRFRPHVFGKEPLWFRLVAPCLADFFHKPEVRQFMDSVREDHLMNEKLRHVRAPVWLLWGENDTLTPAEWTIDWLDRLEHHPSTRAVLIKRAGHSPQVESPALTAALLARILRGNGLSRPQPLLSGLAWKVVR